MNESFDSINAEQLNKLFGIYFFDCICGFIKDEKSKLFLRILIENGCPVDAIMKSLSDERLTNFKEE